VVRIRLRRMGAKKKPFYRIVIADKRSPRDGRFIENIGTYNPLSEPETVVLQYDRAAHWLSVGARPSEAVARLLRNVNLLDESGKPIPYVPEPDAELPTDTEPAAVGTEENGTADMGGEDSGSEDTEVEDAASVEGDSSPDAAVDATESVPSEPVGEMADSDDENAVFAADTPAAPSESVADADEAKANDEGAAADEQAAADADETESATG